MSVVIIHFSYPDKFFAEYVDFIESNFDAKEHKFLFLGHSDRYKIDSRSCIFIKSSLFDYLKIIYYALVADKIILHGLFSLKLNLLFALVWWLPKKSFWVMWGGDFYDALSENNTRKWLFHQNVKRRLIPRISGLITYLEGDYEKVKQWYGAKGRWFYCFAYLSNIYRGALTVRNAEQREEVVVLIGNSADPSNCHEEIFSALLQKEGCFRIICPLSYGDMEYASRVESLGASLFGERFHSLTDFMPLGEYLKLLAKVDVAIFGHRRQQAMGNTIQLLGNGKKVVLREGTTQDQLFGSIDILYETLDNFSLARLDPQAALHNHRVISQKFSETSLAKQWHSIFDARPD